MLKPVVIKKPSACLINGLMVLLCMLPSSVFSADDAPAPTEKTSNTHTKTAQPPVSKPPKNTEKQPQSATKKAKRASRFKPSEEISEDYSVPFPVDI